MISEVAVLTIENFVPKGVWYVRLNPFSAFPHGSDFFAAQLKINKHVKTVMVNTINGLQFFMTPSVNMIKYSGKNF